ncbi:MAG: aminoglycoside phosphotransferase family protein [Pseudomonadota bacterium]
MSSLLKIPGRSNADPDLAKVRLARLTEAQGLTHPRDRWTVLSGGRSNRVWRVSGPASDRVVKLFLEGRETPLFRNSARDEARAIRSLDGTGLAPGGALHLSTPMGEIVIYDHLESSGDSVTPDLMGQTLARLHNCAPPARQPLMPDIGVYLANQISRLRADLRPVQAAQIPNVRIRQPGIGASAVFLHGDPVPANVVMSRNGHAVLIDWQSPRTGDPLWDLAVCASPSMRQLYGAVPWTPAELDTFLKGYGANSVTAQFWRYKRDFHALFAAYGLWMANRGHPDYAAAAQLEIAAL